MRKLQSLFLGLLLGLGSASTASAALQEWEGTLLLQLGTLPPIVATGGSFAQVNGSLGGAHLTTLGLAGGITATVTQPFTDPDITMQGLVSLRATATLGTGVLRPISGGVGGVLTLNTLPVKGEARLCLLFLGCGSFLPIPLTVDGTRGLGIGGIITIGGFAKGGVKISIQGAPWTVNTAFITGVPTGNGAFTTSTAMGFAHGPESLTSSTANGSGVVQLVTPQKVTTTLPGSEVVALFGTLTIHFVPEPSTTLLFCAGIALALAEAGRRRRNQKR